MRGAALMPAGPRWTEKRRARQIFECYAVGMSGEEIARVVKMRPRTVRRILGRAGVGVTEVVRSEREGRTTR